MSFAAAQKRFEAARKRDERVARKRQRELERMLKERAKLTAQDQARLEVEAFENSLEVLLSVHKEASPTFDWMEPLSALSPHSRMNCDTPANEQDRVETGRMRALAQRVLAGNAAAYGEALRELSAFGELANLGSSIAFRVHHPKLIECELKVNGRDAIPTEVKSLTTAGKLSMKAMPKARFHELYQDHVCSCVLRAAREVFAQLPVDAVIVTAMVSTVETSTGNDVEIPILSVVIGREALDQLDLSRIDPSDAMENFTHRGDVIASRKSGEFTRIVPLKPEDITVDATAQLLLPDLLHRVRGLRALISAELRPPAPNLPAEAKPLSS